MSERCHRLSAILLRELNTLLHQRFREEAQSFSVSFVRVSGDLRTAKVYYLTQSAEKDGEARNFFQRNRGQLRHLLSQRIVLHHFPDLHFYPDGQIERQLRVYRILDDLLEE